MDNKQKRAWDQYWQQGNQQGCIGSAEEGYRTEFVSFWRNEFGQLPSEASILDIGTGKGALPSIALDVAKESGKTFQVSAIDGAEVHPDTSAENLASVRFFGNTQISSMPFQDATFDLVTSQFAAEYMPVSDLVTAIQKVLKPGGHLVILSHVHKGLSVTGARAGLQFIRVLINESKYFDTLQDLINTLCTEREGQIGRFQPSPALTKLKQKLDKAVKRISKAAQTGGDKQVADNTLNVAAHMLANQGQFTAQQMRDKTSELKHSVLMYRERLSMLSESALSQKSAQTLISHLESCGITLLHSEELKAQEGRDILGGIYRFQKVG